MLEVFISGGKFSHVGKDTIYGREQAFIVQFWSAVASPIFLLSRKAQGVRREDEKAAPPAFATNDLRPFPGGLGFGLTLLFLLFRLGLTDRAIPS